MGLDFAIDALYDSGWCESLSESPCPRHSDGRAYPSVDEVARTFQLHGFDFTIRHIQLFDCYRAEWRSDQGGGAVVGQSAPESAVYALSQLRRSTSPALAQ